MAIQAVSNLITDWKDSDDPFADDEMAAEIEEVKRAQGFVDGDVVDDTNTVNDTGHSNKNPNEH